MRFASSRTKTGLLYVYVAAELRQANEIGAFVGSAHSHLQAVVTTGREHFALYRPARRFADLQQFRTAGREIEIRFAQSCSVEDLKLVTAANGTLAIQAALIAQYNRADESRNLCLLPAFTFAGTVSAVIGAGLVPMFVDVDPKTCVIDLDRLQDDDILRRTAAVVTGLASIGHLPDLTRCSAFEARTGVPVIVDAAGCSEAHSPVR